MEWNVYNEYPPEEHSWMTIWDYSVLGICVHQVLSVAECHQRLPPSVIRNAVMLCSELRDTRNFHLDAKNIPTDSLKH